MHLHLFLYFSIIGVITANIMEFLPHTKHCRSKGLRLVILSITPELNYFTIPLTSQIYQKLPVRCGFKVISQGGPNKRAGFCLSLLSIILWPDWQEENCMTPWCSQSLGLQIIAPSQGTKEGRMSSLKVCSWMCHSGPLGSATPYPTGPWVLLQCSGWLQLQTPCAPSESLVLWTTHTVWLCS